MPQRLVCLVQSRPTGDKTEVIREIALRNQVGDWPLWIGSDPDCTIVLEHAEIAPRHAQVHAGGRHFVLTPQAGGNTRAFGKPIAVGTSERIDFEEFEIGPFRLRFAWRD